MVNLAAVVMMSSVDANPTESQMQQMLRQFEADRGTLSRRYNVPGHEVTTARMKSFYDSYAIRLQSLDYESLDVEDRIDWHLLEGLIVLSQRQLEADVSKRREVASLLPFADGIRRLAESRRLVARPSYQADAAELNRLLDLVREAQASLKPGDFSRAAARRAATYVDESRKLLADWFEFFHGYDPQFSWWMSEPHKALSAALESYSGEVLSKVAELAPGDTTTIVGDPIGSDALQAELDASLIAYSPEELFEIAEKEFAWCDEEMRKASRELGFGDDWRKALEHVKTLHVAPGEQPYMIMDLAHEAVRFLEERDLVTIPDLCKETWRMDMMSPERQKVNPFFLGGESIIVSFPTDTMSHEQKMMSMRGNSRHFSRATVQHELIPGHHLQGFMEERYRPDRQIFNTPFWVEGWALYWEFLLYDMGFPRSPEDRIGMLFWRKHRCARILFSLGFHLGRMTPDQCVELLVDRVGHEKDNATAEVRRSFAGDYPPLYQAAYMLGGLQIRALQRELVESGKLGPRQFHDAILQGGPIPIEMVRARLMGTKLPKDFMPKWRFYEAGASRAS